MEARPPPDAPANVFTDIDGGSIVGVNMAGAPWPDQSFLYDGMTWTELEFPESSWTKVWGIEGDNIVGEYGDESGPRGFLYDGLTWNTLDFPGATSSAAYGSDADKIVGSYWDSDWKTHGFLYDGTIWTTLDFPGAVGTYAHGIDGESIVGYYFDTSGDTHGFIYAIPEPGTVLLLGLGGLALLRRRGAGGR